MSTMPAKSPPPAQSTRPEAHLRLTEDPVMTTLVAPTTRPSDKLSLKDRLSRLTFSGACKLLGAEGPKLIRQAANRWDIKTAADVYFGDDLFRLRLPGDNGSPTVVTITQMDEARQ